MSRAFVKEDDAGTPEEQVDLPISAHPNFVTPAGLKMLRDKAKEYEDERAALKQHDDELASQSHLPRVEQEVRYWEERLRTAIPVDLAKQPRDKVAFGAVVTVADEDDNRPSATVLSGNAPPATRSSRSWRSGTRGSAMEFHHPSRRPCGAPRDEDGVERSSGSE